MNDPVELGAAQRSWMLSLLLHILLISLPSFLEDMEMNGCGVCLDGAGVAPRRGLI